MGHLRVQGLTRRAARLRRRLAEEHGVTLIETLISAAILVTIIGAVFTTLDVSNRTAAANRSRTVAASLAEQDQERLRALSAPSLANWSQQRDVSVDGNVYTVRSDTDWVIDATGATEGCLNSGTTQSNYIRITSTVTSSIVGTRIKPVQMRSLVAPRVGDFGEDQGTLAVFVKDERDEPVVDMRVSITGPQAMSERTNEFGCAVFNRIPVGDYTTVLDEPGWVDINRNQHVEQQATVAAGKTTAIAFTYAMAAGIEVRFQTKVGTNSPQPARGNAVTVTNSSMPPRGLDPAGAGRFVSPTDPLSSLMIPATGLFPFPSGYAAYAGNCEANDPSKYDPTYFTSNPGFVNVMPGTVSPVTVHEPALNLQFLTRELNGNLKVLKNADVLIKLTEDGCNSADIVNRFAFKTNNEGRLNEPGLPFGHYEVCVDDGVLKQTLADVDNTSPGGLPVLPDGTPTTRVIVNYDITKPPLSQLRLGGCA